MGGAENMLLKVLPKIKKFDISVCSLTNNDSIGKLIEKKGIKVTYLGMNKINILKIIFRFRRIIKKEKPDLLLTYLPHSDLFGRFFGRIFGVKKIISSPRSTLRQLKYLFVLDKLTSRLVNLYIPNSKAIKDFYLENSFISSNKIKIIPNGLDFDVLPLGKSLKKELKLENKKVLGFVGRLNPQKGLKYLIEAMIKITQKNNKIVLLIVGEGSQRTFLENLVKKNNLENNIIFLGQRTDIANLLTTMDFFVFPTLFEGMSNALLEAMYYGKAIVATNIEENKELIRNNREGLLVPIKNPREIAKKTLELINDKEKAIKFGKNAKERVLKEFNINKTVKLTEEIIGEELDVRN